MHLAIIIREKLEEIVKKGEVIDRYFNPTNLFDQVTLVVLEGSGGDESIAQKMVGKAKLRVIHAPVPLLSIILAVLGGKSSRWIDFVLRPLSTERPDAIRVYGVGVQAVAGCWLREALQAPLVISLHINPDEDIHGKRLTIRDWAYSFYLRATEARTLHLADFVLPVYKSILPYLQRLRVTRFRVCYNVINAQHVRRRSTLALGSPVRLICVGRQFHWKNPEHIIRALTQLPHCTLTLIGDGPAHPNLARVVRELHLENRVNFHRALPNDRVCQELLSHDIFVYHSEYAELAKGVMEAMLMGLPVVHSRRKGPQVEELSHNNCLLTENDADSYVRVISMLIQNEALRLQLIQNAWRFAWQLFAPPQAEAAHADSYREMLNLPSRHDNLEF